MRKRIWILFFGLVLIIGAYSQERLAPPNNPNAAAQSGQAEIIINTGNADKDIAIWINGEIVAHVHPNSNEKIIVNNGQYLIEAADTTFNRGQWKIGTKKQITVDSISNRVTIGMTLRYGSLLGLSVQNTVVLEGGVAPPVTVSGVSSPIRPATPPPVVVESDSIMNAIYRAAWVIIENIADGSTVAVISISCPDPDLAEIIIEELSFHIVGTKKFKVVDRKSLEAIQAEAKFQYSGDVDDQSAVTIGKLLGASVVIIGSVSGSGSTKRLYVRALDVQTSEILTMASERF